MSQKVRMNITLDADLQRTVLALLQDTGYTMSGWLEELLRGSLPTLMRLQKLMVSAREVAETKGEGLSPADLLPLLEELEQDVGQDVKAGQQELKEQLRLFAKKGKKGRKLKSEDQ